jgi:TonB-linked SusC/RagA family outer membrane protein
MKGNSFLRSIKILAIFVLAGLCSSNAFAQNRSISGTVIDNQGIPVIGASVIVVGNSSIGTITDLDGNFSLSVPAGSSVSVSFIGYETQVIAVGNQSVINVILSEDSEFLEETVVVGYGVQKKSDLTGSVASVNGDDFLSRSTTNAAAAIQGKAAGVQILNTSGAPGQGSSIRVRGYSSNGGNLGPLLIVDGLKVSNIDYLDPEMIESMEILKDAASAAIYGAEAGNGVVLITTKSGASNNGRSSITYGAKFTNQFLGKVDAYITDAQEYIDYVRMKGGQIDALLEQYNYDGTSTNWFKETFEPSWTKQHTLTLQGGNNNGHYLTSLNYVDDNGMVKGDYDTYNRIGVTINADYSIYKWLTMGTNISVTHTKTRSVSQQSNFSSVFGAVCQIDPLTPFYYTDPSQFKPEMLNAYNRGEHIMRDENGWYATSKYSDSPNGHPFIQRDRNKNQYGSNLRINGTVYANITPFKGLVFTSRFGSRITQSNSHNFTEPYWGTSASNGGFSTNYSISASVNTGLYYQWENFANYNIDLGKHSIGAMAGMSYINQTNDNASISANDPDLMTGYESNMQYINYIKSDIMKTVSNSPSRSASISYFGRVTYSYDNRYNLQANFRADAFDSSKLSKQSRWGYFPSFSAGWTISNESFVRDNISRNILSFLKLRASWGRNGNINVLSGYPYDATLSLNSSWFQYHVDDGELSLGSAPNGIANPDLKWETSDQVDVGLDARLFNNRLTFAADWYIKDTRGLLVSIPLPVEVGVSSVMKNAGSIRNTGIEFELGWKDVIGEFSYGINGNLSFLKNKVTYLDELAGRITASRGGVSGTDNPIHTVFEEGYPIWYFEGYKFNGVDSATGAAIIEDVNKDGVISEADMTYIGSAFPDATYGITLTGAWKGFDLTVFGTGSVGNDIFNCVSRAGDPFRNGLRYFYLNSWSESNKNAKLPDPKQVVTDWHFYGSSACLFDGSYFKIKQIQLGYSLPKAILQKARLSNLRLYVSLDDMITFTKYPGLDPETATTTATGGMGFDAGSYPTMKKVLLGVTVTL